MAVALVCNTLAPSSTTNLSAVKLFTISFSTVKTLPVFTVTDPDSTVSFLAETLVVKDKSPRTIASFTVVGSLLQVVPFQIAAAGAVMVTA